ncbi:MAG: transposase, partial [Pseudanabaena sp.]
ESEAEFNLELFAEKWDKLYPSISKSWRSHWANIIPFFAFPLEIRKAKRSQQLLHFAIT